MAKTNIEKTPPKGAVRFSISLSAEQKKLVVENSKIASQVLSSYSKTI